MASPCTDAWDGPFDGDAIDRLRHYIQKNIDDGHAYGACMTVARGGRAGRQLCFGVADCSGKRIARNDVFVATSLANCFTALVVLRAIDHGRFTLETKISGIVPCFRNSNKEDITIRQCLTHTSGLNSALGSSDNTDLEDYVNSVSTVPIVFAPGSRCSFTPLINRAVLGQLLVCSDPQKRPFAQIMQQELFDPIGMHESRFGAKVCEPSQICLTTTEGQTATILAPSKPQYNGSSQETIAPGGALWTTVKDIFRFADILRQRGCNERYRLVSRSMFDYAAKNHTGDLTDDLWSTESMTQVRAQITLLGGHVRGEMSRSTIGLTASPKALSSVENGSAMWFVDPDRDLIFVFRSEGHVDGPAHIERLSRLVDLALATCG